MRKTRSQLNKNMSVKLLIFPYRVRTSSDKGLELQCLLKVKKDLSKVLIFQHAILNAK